jgi:hypothetical protein
MGTRSGKNFTVIVDRNTLIVRTGEYEARVEQPIPMEVLDVVVSTLLEKAAGFTKHDVFIAYYEAQL